MDPKTRMQNAHRDQVIALLETQRRELSELLEREKEAKDAKIEDAKKEVRKLKEELNAACRRAREKEEEHERLRKEKEDLEEEVQRLRESCGALPLWDVIVNNDDICFKHILPRLNQTDKAFLYDVNTETKALIKRARRSGIKLEMYFQIEQMSSISTLEFLWENRSPRLHWMGGTKLCSGTKFCSFVAQTNKLELLKWIREEKKCDWDEKTINLAAHQGNLEMVKYCVENQCPMDECACISAAQRGNLELLKYLRETAKAPWDWRTAAFAAENGHLHILEYLVEHKYDDYDKWACRNAARNGHLDCLKYLRETAKAPWDFMAVQSAHTRQHWECLQYLLDNDCPLPHRWRYEDGVLYNRSGELLYDSRAPFDTPGVRLLRDDAYFLF